MTSYYKKLYTIAISNQNRFVSICLLLLYVVLSYLGKQNLFWCDRFKVCRLTLRFSANKPSLTPLPVAFVAERSKTVLPFSLIKCLFVSVCLLCFCNHLHSCCFHVLVLCCSDGCLLCMLCFLYLLFPLIDFTFLSIGSFCARYWSVYVT